MSQSLSGQSVFYEQSTWDSPIGLARDGHIVIGPYKSDGSTWGCADRDVCNGAFVDGSYVYVGSDTFPYVVGCWGPGPAPLHVPGCTTNGCGATESNTSSTSSTPSTSGGTNSSSDSYGIDDGAVSSIRGATITAISLLIMTLE